MSEGKGVEFWACRVCGCTDVEGEFWVHLNDFKITDESGDTYWCPQCDDHHKSLDVVEKPQPFKAAAER